MIDSVFMQIAVVSYKFSSRAVKLVKIFFLKLLKIDLNTVSNIVVFDICGYVFIKFVYCILVNNVIVSRLNIYIVVNKDF